MYNMLHISFFFSDLVLFYSIYFFLIRLMIGYICHKDKYIEQFLHRLETVCQSLEF